MYLLFLKGYIILIIINTYLSVVCLTERQNRNSPLRIDWGGFLGSSKQNRNPICMQIRKISLFIQLDKYKLPFFFIYECVYVTYVFITSWFSLMWIDQNLTPMRCMMTQRSMSEKGHSCNVKNLTLTSIRLRILVLNLSTSYVKYVQRIIWV